VESSNSDLSTFDAEEGDENQIGRSVLVFYNYFPLLRAFFPEYLSQNRCVSGIFDIKVDSVANVIKKCP
jgi:hypothetical protein